MTQELRTAVEVAIKKQGRQKKWVAEQGGVSYPQFSRMMSGSNLGSVAVWLRILDVLGLELTVTPRKHEPRPEAQTL